MRVAGRGEQGPGPGAWRSGGGLGPVGFPQVGASGGGGGLRGGGEEMAVDGQPGPGELLPRPPPRLTTRGGVPPCLPAGTWACPALALPSGLAMASGPVLLLRAPGPARPCPVPSPVPSPP